jgi:hypothetical protein
MGCINGGRVGMACVRVLWASWKRRRIAGKKYLKSSSSLSLHAQGRRRTVLKRHCFGLFFFEENENKFGSDPKMGYDSCPPLYNAYGAKTLHSRLVKKTKGNKMI